MVNEENSDNSIVGDENKAPPMLPELESVGEVPDTEMVKNHKIGHPRIRRQPSGWFGGEKMFDGIGQH